MHKLILIVAAGLYALSSPASAERRYSTGTKTSYIPAGELEGMCSESKGFWMPKNSIGVYGCIFDNITIVCGGTGANAKSCSASRPKTDDQRPDWSGGINASSDDDDDDDSPETGIPGSATNTPDNSGNDGVGGVFTPDGGVVAEPGGVLHDGGNTGGSDVVIY